MENKFLHDQKFKHTWYCAAGSPTSKHSKSLGGPELCPQTMTKRDLNRTVIDI